MKRPPQSRPGRLALTSALVMLAAQVAFDGQAWAQDEAGESGAATEPVEADTVIAKVGSVDITAGHLLLMRGQLPQQYQNLPVDQLYDGLVQQAISQALLAGTLESDLPLAADLAIENQERAVRANVAMQRISEAAASEDAVQAAYDDAYGDQQPTPEYNAAHILVPTQEEAVALKAELDAGADFAQLAQENSTGPSGPNGGALGWFGPGMMVPEFEAAVTSLTPGEVSGPVETQFGWHLVKLNEEREKAPPTLEEVRADLETQLQQEAIQSRITELEGEVDPQLLNEGIISPDFLNDPSLLEE